jgi:hypothetical protein
VPRPFFNRVVLRRCGEHDCAALVVAARMAVAMPEYVTHRVVVMTVAMPPAPPVVRLFDELRLLCNGGLEMGGACDDARCASCTCERCNAGNGGKKSNQDFPHVSLPWHQWAVLQKREPQLIACSHLDDMTAQSAAQITNAAATAVSFAVRTAAIDLVHRVSGFALSPPHPLLGSEHWSMPSREVLA